MTRVLTVNPGSNSLQLHLVSVNDDGGFDVLAERSAEHRQDEQASRDALGELLTHDPAPDIVGHRVVHGGPRLREPTMISDDAVDRVRAAQQLAPQHVPVTLRLVELVTDLAPDLDQVLCPDTGFHRDLPEYAARYALPEQWRLRYDIRRYGFQGLSCGWALREASAQLGRPADELHLLIAHLGGGCSVTAVAAGNSVDTSMGFTPLEGMAMSSRSGSIDPGLLLWLIEHAGMSPAEVREGISSRSGLLGLSDGRSGDTRDLVTAAAGGDDLAAMALEVFAHRARREIAAAATSLPRIDALVFTGEIGYDQPEVRNMITDGLAVLRDPRVLVVEPREELQLAHLSAATASTTEKSGVDVPDRDGGDLVDEWELESFPASDPPAH